MISKQQYFDYCISNPPYQMDASTESNNTAHNIFHLFYDSGLKISNHLSMIFPGGRWMQRSMRGTHAANIIYPTVKTIEWFPNSTEKDVIKPFPSVLIHDGISIVTADNNISNIIMLNNEKFGRPDTKNILPLSTMSTTISRIMLNWKKGYLVDKKLSVGFFLLRSYYAERYPEKVSPVKTDKHTIVSYMANGTKGSAKRVMKQYIPYNTIDWNNERKHVYKKYKVCASQGNISKMPASTNYIVVENDTVIGESWVIVGVFDTIIEAENYKKYLDNELVRKLLNESKGGKLGKWGYFVPDLINYSHTNPDIDWRKPLEQQLEKLFGLLE